MEVSAILLQQSLSYFLIKRGSLMLMNTHIALKGTLLRGPYLYYYWCYWPLANIENKKKLIVFSLIKMLTRKIDLQLSKK